jgi:anti-sigma-28 factor FlgM
MNRRAKRRTGIPHPDLPTTRKDETVNRLKQQIVLGRYRVDADAVASEILSKLRLLSSGRRALVTDASARAGRQPGTTQHE